MTKKIDNFVWHEIIELVDNNIADLCNNLYETVGNKHGNDKDYYDALRAVCTSVREVLRQIKPVNSNQNTDCFIQAITGTLDIDMARGLAYGLLEACSRAMHNISRSLHEGKDNAPAILEKLEAERITLNHHLSMLAHQVQDFDGLCERIRKDCYGND